MSRLCGIFGKPYLDLEPFFDLAAFPALDREITMGLSRVEPTYTGGTLKWMGVVAPWLVGEMDDGHRDAMHAIRDMTLDEWRDFISLADDPSAFDEARFREYVFGDETDHPFTRAQMELLKLRHGVYFPWKVCYHLLENDRWEDKHSGEGKSFSSEAREVFPQTVAFIESLPFVEIGRVVLFGIEAHDHAPYHRDSEPGRAESIAQSISFCPRGDKRFALRAGADGPPTVVTPRIYWFNDMDWHGVEPDPFFRYSIRVDGTFDPAFVRELRTR
jgi:Rieske 2Fe-2S family protein